MGLLATALTVSVTTIAAAAFYPALGLGRGRRIIVLVSLIPLILLTPLAIPAALRFHRFLAAVVSGMMIVKLVDMNISMNVGRRLEVRALAAYLVSPFSIVQRKLELEPSPARRQCGFQFVRGIFGFAAGVAVFAGLRQVGWKSYPFACEHVAKVAAFYLLLMPGAAAAAAVWRLMGGRAREPMDYPAAARTPADFWRRWNRPVQQFFQDDLFRRAGGRRAPVRATLLCFAVSALIHEYIFTIATGRLRGYQALFFMLQGCASAATLTVRPTGRQVAPWIAGTLAFNFVTSTLFFASLNDVVPFYAPRH